LEPHVARVVVAARKELRAISEAKVKTDRRDARTLARLLAAGLLDGCWLPDEKTRSLRRRLSRRAQLVRQRTRCKNEVHAVLMRNLKGRPPMSDLFGKSGRVWLGELELPGDERQTVDGCLRQIDFLDAEIALVDGKVAQFVLGSADAQRLMTIPGIDITTAAALIAAIGDIARFASLRQLVAYLGLDPKVRQCGAEPARHGRISKSRPSARGRCAEFSNRRRDGATSRGNPRGASATTAPSEGGTESHGAARQRRPAAIERRGESRALITRPLLVHRCGGASAPGVCSPEASDCERTAISGR
jgi:transposase